MNQIKPRCNLLEQDGNIFNLGGLAGRALRNAGIDPAPMFAEIEASKSYDAAIQVIMKYVDVSSDEADDDEE